MMNETFNLAIGALTGVALGGFFFAGLWWTVHKGLASEHAALWFLGSLVLRTAVVLFGLFYISIGSWQRLLAALIGLIIARFVVMQITRGATGPRASAQETPRAS